MKIMKNEISLPGDDYFPQVTYRVNKTTAFEAVLMENEQALSHCEKVGELDLAIVLLHALSTWCNFQLQSTRYKYTWNSPLHKLKRFPLANLEWETTFLAIRLMRTTVNSDKVFYVSSDQLVFFNRFCTKSAHNRKCTATKFVRQVKNKFASLRASSPFKEYREKSRTHFCRSATRKQRPFTALSLFCVLARLASHGQME